MGRFNGGFLALRVWGAYIWRGLYTEGLIFGILRLAKCTSACLARVVFMWRKRMKDLLPRALVVVTTSNMNFTSSFDRLRQKLASKGVWHVQHDYFSSFNQLNHWFMALSLPFPPSFLQLPNNKVYNNTQILLYSPQRTQTFLTKL